MNGWSDIPKVNRESAATMAEQTVRAAVSLMQLAIGTDRTTMFLRTLIVEAESGEVGPDAKEGIGARN